MAYVTDLTHFDGVLEPGTKAPAPARRLATFLYDVVQVASRETDDGTITTEVRCFKRPHRKACTGRVESTRVRGSDTIEWGCPACGEHGFINNWRGGPADLSRHARSAAGPRQPAEPAPDAHAGAGKLGADGGGVEEGKSGA